MHIISDYYWLDKNGLIGGIFVFLTSKQLAGVEVYSMDGECDDSQLPEIEWPVPLGHSGNVGSEKKS